MNKQLLSRSLITLALAALVGAVGAQTYYTHELVQRVGSREAAPAAVTEQGLDPAPAAPDVDRWDPWASLHADMERMQARMDQAFGNAFQGMHGMPNPDTALVQRAGRVTVEEQGDDYVVKADLPGARESDIAVDLNGRILSITASTRGGEQEDTDNGQVLRRESYASSMQRAFSLPGPVSAAGMHSEYRDGVLTVTVPKAG